MASNGKMGANGGVIRHSSFKGRIVFSTWKGVPRVSVQPIRAKKKISPRHREAIEKFKEAAELAKLCAPSQQIAAYRQTKGTQYFPRDVLYMAFYGRLATIVTETGRRIYSVAAKSEVSEVLDAVAQVPGSLLFRGPSGWEMLLPGAELDVLQFLDGKPAWAAGGGGGGGGYFSGNSYMGTVPGFSSTQYSTKSIPFKPRVPLRPARVAGLFNQTLATAPHVWSILRVDDDAITGEVQEVIWVSPEGNVPAGNFQVFESVVENPPLLVPDATYLLAVTYMVGGVTSRTQPLAGVYQNTAWMINAPIEPLGLSIAYATKVPAVGDTPALVVPGFYCFWLDGFIA